MGLWQVGPYLARCVSCDFSATKLFGTLILLHIAWQNSIIDPTCDEFTVALHSLAKYVAHKSTLDLRVWHNTVATASGHLQAVAPSGKSVPWAEATQRTLNARPSVQVIRQVSARLLNQSFLSHDGTLAEYRALLDTLGGQFLRFSAAEATTVLCAVVRLKAANATVWQQAEAQQSRFALSVGELFQDPGFVSGLTPPQCAISVWAFGRLDLGSCQAPTTVVDRLITSGQLMELTAKEVAMVAWGFATVRCGTHQQWDSLATHLLSEGTMDSLGACSVANVAWAFATMRMAHPALFSALAARATREDVLWAFKAQEVVNVAWAFATVGFAEARLFRGLLHRLQEDRLVDHFTSQGLANLLWAFATLGVRDEAGLALLAARLSKPGLLGRFRMQELAVTAWACATLLVPDLPSALAATLTAVVGAAAQQAAQGSQLAALRGQPGAMLLWACARAGVGDPALAGRVGRGLLQQPVLAELRGKEVSMAIWACAKLNVTDAHLVPQLCAHVLQPEVLASLDSQGVANIAWALATLRLPNKPLMVALASRMLQEPFLATFSPQNLANTVWAFAVLRLRSEALMAHVAQRLHHPAFLAQFTDQELSNVAWAYGALRIPNEEAMCDIARQLLGTGILAQASGQAVAITAWAFGTLGLKNSALMAALAEAVLRPVPSVASQSGPAAPVVFVNTLAPQNVALIMWSFAMFRIRHPPLLAAVQAHLTHPAGPSPLASWRERDLVMVLWSLAIFRERNETMLFLICHRLRAASIAPTIAVTSAVIASWALAALRYSDPALLAALVLRLTEGPGLAELPCQDLATRAWAWAKLGRRNKFLA
eukprot:EG_transcript_3351